MGKLEGRRAIITGGGKGIGRGLALGFAREGARVAVCSRTDADISQVAAEIRAAGGDALAVPVDVSDSAAVNRLVQAVVDAWGGVDILVNNAGVPMVHKPSDELPLTNWRQALEIHLTGSLLCAQAVAPHMKAQRAGKIINLASLTTFIGMPYRVAYVTAKSGVAGLTRALAVEWAPYNIQVNALAPGWIRTPLQDRLVAEGRLDRTPIIERTPAKRVGEVEDLVGPAVFLASADSDFVCGQILAVDGGWLAYGYPDSVPTDD